jgi:hypothetical protein
MRMRMMLMMLMDRLMKMTSDSGTRVLADQIASGPVT